MNHQPARQSPRVSLHSKIRQSETPDWLPGDAWSMWCEHREAKSKDAPWTQAAATVSIRRLGKLRDLGHDAAACIEEAVLRGWTGLFPPRAGASGGGVSQAPAPGWWKTTSGIESRATQLGVQQKDGEAFMRFKARVVKAAGPGEWMEDMLREQARFKDGTYDALYSYFNEVPREQLQAEVA
ncbi:hypothetical protein QS306_14510 [Paraburkholderia bonniea]|uniref:hypothetical protein n=1 Tax=Paraburkholderia bonniea TaxID=2152891 RepID=UPI001FE76938|nr:hypothetical protein [Paraburkholderia bonniea]WJF91981.1 hypothetical protein QS306_14510 [Paraburkholderia bonniea]WJF95300.1 hypothetical protein QS308_14515 [Paraburkholderia bonniea]